MKNLKTPTVALLLSVFPLISCSEESYKGPGGVREADFSGLYIQGLGRQPRDLSEKFESDGTWISNWPIQAKGDWSVQWDGSVCVTIWQSVDEKYEGQAICRVLSESDGKTYFPSAYDPENHIQVVIAKTAFVR